MKSESAAERRPVEVPLLKVLPRLVKDPPNVLAALTRGTDVPVRLGAGPASIWLVAHPDHVQHVLVDNNRNYWKGKAFNRAGVLFGRGLVLNEGDSWLAQRRLMSPAFSHARVAALVPLMADVVEKRIARWRAAARAGQPVEMVREMMSVTLAVIARTMFSLSVTDDEIARMARAFHTVLQHLTTRINTFFLPEWIALPGWRKARAAIGVLEEVVERVVRERRASRERPEDLLSMLLDARDAATGEGMSERQLRDEVLTILFGGYEATADALAWTWMLLAQHPGVDARFRFEVENAVSGDVPTVEELGRLEYTTRVIYESMRVRPPFWWILRSSLGEDRVGGCRVPAGATVLVLLYATHRDPAWWGPDPEAFDPDRFLPERAAARLRHAFLPFGAGQHACIGRHLALLEMQLALAMLAREFRPALVPGFTVATRALASLRARDGIWMHLHRAERPAAAA